VSIHLGGSFDCDFTLLETFKKALGSDDVIQWHNVIHDEYK